MFYSWAQMKMHLSLLSLHVELFGKCAECMNEQ